MNRLTKADVGWLKNLVRKYKELIEDYPELVSSDDLDDIEIADQIIKEKLS